MRSPACARATSWRSSRTTRPRRVRVCGGAAECQTVATLTMVPTRGSTVKVALGTAEPGCLVSAFRFFEWTAHLATPRHTRQHPAL